MIEIDSMWLFEAIEDHSGTVHFYLDRHTGEVLRISEMFESEEEQEETYGRMRAEPARWIEVEPMPSRDAFRVMEDFVRDLPEGEQKRTLNRALSWKKPFGNFKRALYEMPELKTAWHTYHDARIRRVAEEWLASEGIQAKLK
jgi:hypothetical protein